MSLKITRVNQLKDEQNISHLGEPTTQLLHPLGGVGLFHNPCGATCWISLKAWILLHRQTPSFQIRKILQYFCQLVYDFIVEPNEAKASAWSADIYSSKVALLWMSCDHMCAQLTSLTLAILFASSAQV